jgi:hypothetical protein
MNMVTRFTSPKALEILDCIHDAMTEAVAGGARGKYLETLRNKLDALDTKIRNIEIGIHNSEDEYDIEQKKDEILDKMEKYFGSEIVDREVATLNSNNSISKTLLKQAVENNSIDMSALKEDDKRRELQRKESRKAMEKLYFNRMPDNSVLSGSKYNEVKAAKDKFRNDTDGHDNITVSKKKLLKSTEDIAKIHSVG